VLDEDGDPLKEKVRAQVNAAIDTADLILFLLDVEAGLTPLDEDISLWLRRIDKPIITVVNKVDNIQRELSSAEFHQLGLVC